MAGDRRAVVRAAFAAQAEWCRRLGSPFTAFLCDTVGARLDRRTAVGRRVLDWPGDPDSRADALPLRFAGALNGLVRAGSVPDLARLYPPSPLPAADELWAAIEAVLETRAADLDRWLDRAPQTNEVARSAVLMAGLLQVAAETGLPLDLLELGASAGLNLVLDHYAYRLGGLNAGDEASALTLAPVWQGGDPPRAPVRIESRRGVDLLPIDIGDAGARNRLLAYVWPDQSERVARIEAALTIAETVSPPIDKADAAEWLERQLASDAPLGVARVVMHSIAFQYFPPAAQARIRALLAETGARSTSRTPLAWLQYEIDPELGGPASLRLTLWPGGQERRLAIADPHARQVEWL